MLRRVLSVVIEVRGDQPSLPEVVARVRAQKVSAELELVAIERGRRQVAWADTVVSAPKHWSQGEAWNAAFSAARGEVLVLLSPHALPADPRWLLHLVAPLAKAEIAAVFARQLPRPGFMERASRPVRLEACAAFSRAAWDAQPFEPMDGAELEAWARRAHAAGRALVHSHAATVFYGAPRRPVAELVEVARSQRRLAQTFGAPPLALPTGIPPRALPVPLAALAGGLWARVEAKFGRGAARP